MEAGLIYLLGFIVLALIAAFLWFYGRGTQYGQQAAELDARKDHDVRVDRGSKAIHGRDELTPDQRLRDNDGKW